MSPAPARAALLALLLCQPAAPARARTPAPDLRPRADAVLAAPDVVYQTDLQLPCSPRTWGRLVDAPALMGQLWNAYGYGPAYRVSERGDTIHVEDPTGLVGDLHLLAASDRHRQYLAHGRLDHWAVPFMNRGDAVFTLDLEPVPDAVRGRLTVHVKAGHAVAGFLMRLGRPVLSAHVANRIDLNLKDAGQLLHDVEHIPDQVRLRLPTAAAQALAARLDRPPP